MKYEHTQIGYLILSIILIFIILFTLILKATKLYATFIPIIILIFFILISFATLTTTVDKTNLKIKFGYGIYKKIFPLKEIASTKTVRNHWYYGWGIRLWLWPKMWIYNISGFDAVEIKMKDNKIYRIGTDEPKKLTETIKNNLLTKK